MPHEARHGDDVVVCLHGAFTTAGVLRPLRWRLERHDGIHTATMPYPLGPGVRSIAHRLQELLSELPAGAQIHLLAHSLVAVISRYFAPVDYVGLYWHLVDMIWIYLFPLLYLIH